MIFDLYRYSLELWKCKNNFTILNFAHFPKTTEKKEVLNNEKFDHHLFYQLLDWSNSHRAVNTWKSRSNPNIFFAWKCVCENPRTDVIEIQVNIFRF